MRTEEGERHTSVVILGLLFGVVALAVIAVPLHGQSDTKIVDARVAAFTGRIPASHPRLLLKADERPRFRSFVAALQADRERAPLWARIALAPSGQTLPPEPAPVPAAGKRDAAATALWRKGYATANEAGNTALRFALQYLVTGDANDGRESARWLVHLAGWDVNGGIDIRNNDEAFIQSLRPMIFAYDWAFDALTPDERSIVRDAIRARLDILWRDVSGTFSLTRATPGGASLSHPMRFISTLGQGALALWGESPGVEPYLAWAYEYYLRQFPVWGGADGGWAEGIDYWGTGLTQHVRFLEGMALLGFAEPLQRPFFRQNGYFALYNLQPYPTSSFGDLTNVTQPTPSRALLVEKYALLNHDPYLMAYARQLSATYPEGFSYYEFNAIDSLLHLFRAGQASVPVGNLGGLPGVRRFADIGWVAMHTSLGDRDGDVMLAFKSSGYGSASHSHADQNAFVINGFGQPLAISSGYRDWYGSAHHLGWTRTTASKNAVLIGGEGQPILDPSATGRISRFQAGDLLSITTGDASQAYRQAASRALRHILFVNRRYFILLDEIDARKAVTCQWLLHARDQMAIDPGAASLTVAKGPARLRAQFLVPAPEALTFGQTSEFVVPPDPAYRQRMPNEWHARAETRDPRIDQDFLVVLTPYRTPNGAPVPAKRLETTSGYAVQVEDRDGMDVVLIGGERSMKVTGQGTELDGVAGMVRLEGGVVTGFAAVEAMRLDVGVFRLSASTRFSGEGRVSGDAVHVVLGPHLALELMMFLPFAPREVKGVGGDAWHFDARNSRLMLRLSKDQTGFDVVK